MQSVDKITNNMIAQRNTCDQKDVLLASSFTTVLPDRSSHAFALTVRSSQAVHMAQLNLPLREKYTSCSRGTRYAKLDTATSVA